MKKLYFISIATLALLSTACQKDKILPEEPTEQQPVVSDAATIKAFVADTKATLANGETTFDVGDVITISQGEANYSYQWDGAAWNPQGDYIKKSADHHYSLCAVFGNSFSVDQIITDGKNESEFPLSGSVDKDFEDDLVEITLQPQTSVLELVFAQEAATLNSLTLKSLADATEITVTFTDGLDLTNGANAQILFPAYNSNKGWLLTGSLTEGGNDVTIVRTMWRDKSVEIAASGTHFKQPLSTWRIKSITTAAQLCELAYLVNNGHATTRYQDPADNNEINLGANISLKGVDWTPIGNAENDSPKGSGNHQFTDVFDGNDKTIDYLQINSTETNQYQGSLFGVISGNAVIKNLTIGDNSSITYKRSSGMNRLGAVVCFVRDASCKLINITNYASVTNDQVNSYAWVGGIAGQCRGTMTNCVNHGKVIAKGNYAAANSAVGGVAGIDDSSSNTHTRLENHGEVEVNAPNFMITAAGIIGTVGTSGKTYKCKLEGCTNYGSVTMTSPTAAFYVAGVLGYDYCSTKTHTNLVNEGAITVSAPSATVYAFVGGVVGHLYKSSLTFSTNKGDILVQNNTGASEQCFIGGVAGNIGLMAESTTTVPDPMPKCETLKNFGNISYLVEANLKGIIGGVAGRVDFVDIDGWENYGTITLQKNSRLGGLLGTCYYQKAEVTASIKNCGFYGTIDADAANNDVNLLIGTFTSGTLEAENIKVDCKWKCAASGNFNVINSEDSCKGVTNGQIQSTYNVASTATKIRLANTDDATRYNTLYDATSYGAAPAQSND